MWYYGIAPLLLYYYYNEMQQLALFEQRIIIDTRMSTDRAHFDITTPSHTLQVYTTFPLGTVLCAVHVLA